MLNIYAIAKLSKDENLINIVYSDPWFETYETEPERLWRLMDEEEDER